jgi:hypothetical protein
LHGRFLLDFSTSGKAEFGEVRMWYRLNQILLALLLAGGAVYGLIVFINAPPILRQEGQGEGQLQKQAKKDLQNHLKKLQDQQAEAFQRAMEQGRSASGS